MRAALQYASWLLGLPLELLIIGALVRGAYRRFPVLLAYSLVVFLTTIADISVYQAYYSGVKVAHTFAYYYWINEALRQSLVFAVVISLIYEATAVAKARTLLRTCLVCGAIVFAGVSFLIHYDVHSVPGKWMTLWSRDIDFSTAILDLALWAILLTWRHKDMQLLLLSGGIGIEFTGEAIGQSLRSLFPGAVNAGNAVILLANLAGMWVWWQALRPVRAQQPASVRSAKVR
jgi:hypothetical protein